MKGIAALLCICSLQLIWPRNYCNAQNVLPRRHLSFDEDWKFHPGNVSDPSRDFNYSIANIFSKTGGAAGTAIEPKYADTAWRTVNLPHDWAVELPFVNSPNYDVSHMVISLWVVCFLKQVSDGTGSIFCRRKDSGLRFQIWFDGIFRDANIWINGIYLGNNKSGYVGVAYDITDYLNYDKENIMVVRAGCNSI